jgi:GNAT superfamily N-acetyltransferase
MLIRPAVVEDAEAIARARVAAWQTAYRGLVQDEVLDALDAEKEALRWRESIPAVPPERCVFVAEVEGQGVGGFASIGPCRDNDPEYSGELYAIYIHPRFQRRGLGRALLQASAGWLRQHGHTRMLLWVLRDNQPARRFYEAAGGVLARQMEREIYGIKRPEVAYGYELM